MIGETSPIIDVILRVKKLAAMSIRTEALLMKLLTRLSLKVGWQVRLGH